MFKKKIEWVSFEKFAKQMDFMEKLEFQQTTRAESVKNSAPIGGL